MAKEDNGPEFKYHYHQKSEKKGRKTHISDVLTQD
jgi:hypothetical protein